MGFSLVELMAVLVIASVLYFVALPAYEYTVLKSTRAAARGILLDVLTRQEQFFINNKHYATALPGLGLPEPYYIDGQAQAVSAERAAYAIVLELRDGTYSGVTARPRNRQLRDTACLAFSITRTGIRGVSGELSAEPEDCW